MSLLTLLVRLLVAVTATLGTTGSKAQLPAVVERPAVEVGQSGKYRTIDLWTNRETGSWHSEVVDVQAQKFVSRSTDGVTGEVTTRINTLDGNPCRTMKGSDVEVCSGPFKFPMRVGDKTQIDKRPWSSGEGYDTAACEVKVQESVTVAAGTFDVFRVVCTGLWNRVAGGSYSGRLDETYWYAPRVGRTVLFNNTTYRPNSSIDNKRKFELTEYGPK